MKVGDLVKDKYVSPVHDSRRIGVVLSESPRSSKLNKYFKVLWRDGTIGKNVWDYDLSEVYHEDR